MICRVGCWTIRIDCRTSRVGCWKSRIGCRNIRVGCCSSNIGYGREGKAAGRRIGGRYEKDRLQEKHD